MTDRRREDREQVFWWTRKHWSNQKVAARKLGTSQPHLSEYLAGRRELSFEQIVRFSRITKIPLEVFADARFPKEETS